VIAYVDGFNLYYGLRSKGWKQFYWLNIHKLVLGILKPNQVLIKTKYFTSIVSQPNDKHKRQAIFLEALQTLDNFEIFYGHFLSDTVTCRNCGHTYQTYHEKMTDVNIAIELMSDAYQDKFDTALLISADSDLVGPVQIVQNLFAQKRIVVAFPPGRFSNALKAATSGYTFINRDVLSKSIFSDQVVKADGFVYSGQSSGVNFGYLVSLCESPIFLPN
jgi:uncharacterized LabA/DUF88 family protein